MAALGKTDQTVAVAAARLHLTLQECFLILPYRDYLTNAL